MSLFLAIFEHLVLQIRYQYNKNKDFQHVLFEILLIKQDIKKWLK